MSKKLFMMAIIMSALLLPLAVDVLVVKAEPKTITVPDDYPTIQAALNSASEGDKVFVKSGTYSEDLIINTPLSLVGENKYSTIVVGNGNTACLIRQDKVNVTGFTFKRPSTMRWYYGIHLLNVKHCNVFENNVESTFYGIWLVDASFNNVFKNAASGNWNGIHLTTSDHNNISDNSVTGSHDLGISTEGSNYNLIMGNYVASNGWSGIELDGGSPNTDNLIAQNTIAGNAHVGIEITSTGSSNNKIVGNDITATGSEGLGNAISIAWDSNLVMNNNIVGNVAGIRLDGCKNNTICQNVIENNPQGAILIHSPPYRMASQNIIYENNIMNSINLTGNVQEQSWDNGTVGNYWSHHNGADANNDGIGDSPYIIDSLNIDHYPLTSKITITTQIPDSFLSPFSTPTPSPSPSPTPSLSPSQSPANTPTSTATISPSPSIPEFPAWVIVSSFLASVLLIY